MNNLKFFVLVLTSVYLFSSCKKDEEIKPATAIHTPVPTATTTPTVTPETGEGDVTFNFKALVNGAPLGGSTDWYKNANGDSFTVSTFNYYISNIKFKKADGTVYSETESYHLNKHPDIAEIFKISKVPAGTYTSMEFLIGVDSIRNVSGAQVGALDVKENMFWGWNSGYIFFKLEGTYKTTTITDAAFYGLHVGGFSGRNSSIVKCHLNLENPLIIKKDGASTVFFHTLVDEVFKNPATLDLETYNSVFSTRASQLVAANYMDMFEIHKIEN